MERLPVFFISHGGGPWPWIEDMRVQYHKTEAGLVELGKRFRPKAILCVSGHWEEEMFTVGTSPRPPMVYDYSGFPPHTYHIKYSPAGDTSLATKVTELLKTSGIPSKESESQGLDHGVFVPLYLMYPAADIPVTLLSLKKNLNPQDHLELGKALMPLREENVLILTSGLSYHNLRHFFRGGGPSSFSFERWLTPAVESPSEQRNKLLLNWEKAPAAREAHPREDHLIPLLVAAGAAGDDSGKVLFIDDAFGVTMASYQFG